jgi:ribosomal protein S16
MPAQAWSFSARVFLCQVGTYDPIPSGKDGIKELRLKIDRVKYWMSVGAQPSDMVAVLLWKAGVLPAPPVRYQPVKSVKRSERAALHTATARAISASVLPMCSVRFAGIPAQLPLKAPGGFASSAAVTSSRASQVTPSATAVCGR